MEIRWTYFACFFVLFDEGKEQPSETTPSETTHWTQFEPRANCNWDTFARTWFGDEEAENLKKGNRSRRMHACVSSMLNPETSTHSRHVSITWRPLSHFPSTTPSTHSPNGKRHQPAPERRGWGWRRTNTVHTTRASHPSSRFQLLRAQASLPLQQIPEKGCVCCV